MIKVSPLQAAEVVLFLQLAIVSTTVRGSETPLQQQWTSQIPTAGEAITYGVATNKSSEIYVTGYEDLSFLGPTSGGWNALLSKYDDSGVLLWTQTLDSGRDEASNAVAIDGLGDIYISGFTHGILGGTNLGGRDAFVSKFNPEGQLLWSRQFGSAAFDLVNAVAADEWGNSYLAGITYGGLGETSFGEGDGFLAKYDPDGTLLWRKILGDERLDDARNVVVDQFGDVYLSLDSVTREGCGLPLPPCQRIIKLAKFDAEGALRWEQIETGIGPFDSDSNSSQSLAVDEEGNLFLSGSTTQGGSSVSAFVRKLDIDGNVEWTQRLGGIFDPHVAADGQGSVFLSGGVLAESTPYPLSATLLKLDDRGNTVWHVNSNSASEDRAYNLATDKSGAVYLVGETFQKLNNTQIKYSHAFVTKFSAIPEPATAIQLALWVLLLVRSGRGKRRCSFWQFPSES